MKDYKTFTSLSTNDIVEAGNFYTKVLGLKPKTYPDAKGVLLFKTADNTKFMVYEKEDHTAASHTVLNFEVQGITKIVSDLKSKGVIFERSMNTNEDGISEMGPVRAAWFKDPAENWIALFEGM